MEKYKEMEDRFVQENFDTEKDFRIIPGKKPIMFSAPHSVKHFREGKDKLPEYRSGVIAVFLSELCDAHLIYKTKNKMDDANYDEQSNYRNELIQYIKENRIGLLFDLHISAAFREFSLDIGTGFGKNIQNRSDLLDILRSGLENCYPVVSVDSTFAATHPYTVSASVAKETGIPCFQIEINWNLISDFEKMEELIQCMYRLLEKIEEKL